MKRAALLGVLLALLLVGGASAEWQDAWSVWLNGTNSYINCGSAAALDALFTHDVTVEVWARMDLAGTDALDQLFNKSSWYIRYNLGSPNQVQFNADFATNDLGKAFTVTPSDGWHHFAVTYDSDTATGWFWLDGVSQGSDTSVGAYVSDDVYNLNIGRESGLFRYAALNVSVARISDNIRYVTDFTPFDRASPPAVDAHTIAQWNVDEGSGVTLTDAVGVNNCTITAGAWELFDSQAIRDALAAWWDLEENVGTRYDAYGDQDLTDNNTVGRNTGKVNYASDFTAASYEYLSREDGSAISTGDISYTVGAWVYMDVVTDSTIIGKGDEYALRYDTNHFEFLTGNSVTTETVAAATPAPAATTTWYWLAGYHNRDAATIGIYRNTTLNSEAYVNGGHDGDQALYVARRGDLYLDGRVDEAVILKGWVPNHDTNAWFYNGGSGRSYSDLPMPTPTPSPTPTPTPTPTPSPTPITSAVYLASLPSGGVGVVSASVSAGEAMIVVVGLLLLFLLLYRTLSEKVRLWWTTR